MKPKTQNKKWLPFEEARKFVRSLNLKGHREWRTYLDSGNKPTNIPSNPDTIYKTSGWLSMADWLGTKPGAATRPQGNWLPFKKARKFVHSLNLKTCEEWDKYCLSGRKPANIPSVPSGAYKKSGWLSMADWLGTKPGAATQTRYRSPFEEARKFVRSLNLKTWREWQEYCKSGRKPSNIPTQPGLVYKTSGWLSMADWIGTKPGARPWGNWLPFKKARKFVRSLNLKSEAEWQEYCNSGNRPANIPRTPNTIYKTSGWLSWPDWLGTKPGAQPARHRDKELITLFRELEDFAKLSDDLAEMILREQGLLEVFRRAFPASNISSAFDRFRDDPNPIKVVESLVDVNPNDVDPDIDDVVKPGDAPVVVVHRATHADVHAPDNLPKDASAELVEKVMAASLNLLRRAYVEEGLPRLQELLQSYPEGPHFLRMRKTMRDEVEKLNAMKCPEWKMEKKGKRVLPNIMQRYTALRIQEEGIWGNWAGVGAGKTAAAGLAAFVCDAQLTVVVANNSNLIQWKHELERDFSGTHVHILNEDFKTSQLKRGRGTFLIVNYEKFGIESGKDSVEYISKLRPDLLVFDEVQIAKYRGYNKAKHSKRREALMTLRREFSNQSRCLVMTATPVLNDLTEGKSVLELLTGEKMGIETRSTHRNAMEMHRLYYRYGLRVNPDPSVVNRIDVPTERTDLLPLMPTKGEDYLTIEPILLQAKLDAVRDFIRPGVVIYSYYVAELAPMIKKFVEDLGFSAARYTGDEDATEREENQRKFMIGELDVLIGSSAMALGVDGLQTRCDRMIFLNPPWTSAALEQAVGRVARQGSAFDKTDIVTPRVVMNVNGATWSWDEYRYAALGSKRDLAHAVTDGIIPFVENIDPKILAMNSLKVLNDLRSSGEDTEAEEDESQVAVAMN